MREFTHEERKAAARAVFETMTDNTNGNTTRTVKAASLRDSTIDLIAESWAQGEVVYCTSNQGAMNLLLELIEVRKALGEIVEMKRIERGITEATLDILAFPMRRREIVWFTPDEIQAKLDKNLAAGLRQLADAIDGGAIDGKLIDCRGNGFTAKGDDRAHVLLRVDLAAAIRQTRLEGENNVSGSDQSK